MRRVQFACDCGRRQARNPDGSRGGALCCAITVMPPVALPAVHGILTATPDIDWASSPVRHWVRCVMFEEFVAVIHSMGVTVMKIVPVSIALGAVFTVLTFFWACNPGQPWWRKRELVTDLCYWFIIPLFARYLRIGLLVIGAAFLFNITTAEGLVEFYDDGHGPLAQLPLWLQAGIFLVGSDLMMYWIHRTFHRPVLWKYHAVHHSSEDLDWISAARFHPVNIFLGSVAADVVLLLAGISPNVLVFLGPFTIAHSAFVHANLNWTLGPFRYVLAGPGVPSLAPHRGRAGRREELRLDLSGPRPASSAPSICRSRRCPTPMASPTKLSSRLRRADDLSVPAVMR